MGALPLEGSQLGGARKSAFRPAVLPKVPPTQARPKQGVPCPAEGCGGPALSCGPELCLLPLSIRHKGMCHLYLEGAPPLGGFSGGGQGSVLGTIRGRWGAAIRDPEEGGAASPALGGVLASHSCQSHPGLPAPSAAKGTPYHTPLQYTQLPSPLGPSPQGRVPFRNKHGTSAVSSGF